MACFPNLPGFEYLMQSPEGGNRFSGLPQLLSARAFNDVYVYNGDFAWDSQAGFRQPGHDPFRRAQRLHVDPVVADPTWGVSDQDMFDRAVQELARWHGRALLCAAADALQPHLCAADPLPVPAVTGMARWMRT